MTKILFTIKVQKLRTQNTTQKYNVVCFHTQISTKKVNTKSSQGKTGKTKHHNNRMVGFGYKLTVNVSPDVH
jgi:hypothetical protein